MKKGLVKKGLVLGLIVLFVGASVVPSVLSSEIQNISAITRFEACYDCDWIVDDEGDGNFTSIQEAIDNESVQNGSTICVYSGTYERIHVDKELEIVGIAEELGNGSDTGKPIINASFVNYTVTISANNVRITGFGITGSGKDFGVNDAGVLTQDPVEGCTVNDNVIHHNSVGIRAHGTTTIINNTISNNSDDGIKMKRGPTVESNYIANNGGDGVEIHRAAKGITISNNVIIGNRVDGIWDDDSDSLTIIENEILGNGNAGIHFEEGKECKIIGNTISNNHKGICLDFSSSKNDIHKNKILDNKVGIKLRLSSFDTIEKNDILGNDLPLWLTFSILDMIRYNNIKTTQKILLRAIFSLSFAPFNWWGDWRGPWLGTNRILGAFVLVFPWSPIEIPIDY